MRVFFQQVFLPSLLALALVLTWRAYLRHPSLRVRLLGILRTLLLLSLGLLLAFPSMQRVLRRDERPVVAILLDTSRSMTLPVGGETPPGAPSTLPATSPSAGVGARTDTTRWEAAVEAVHVLQAHLSDHFEVSLHGFDRKGSVLDALPERPEGLQSSLASGLEHVLGHHDPARLRGILVVSDGRSTDGGGPRSWARSSRAPIVTVQVGEEELEAPDRAVVEVQAPERLHLKAVGQIRARIAERSPGGGSGGPRARGMAHLLRDGKRVDQRPYDLAVSNWVEFPLRPESPGLETYTVEVPAFEGELTSENNRQSLPVVIESEARRVLSLVLTPSWDHAFFLRRLRQDPRFEVEVASAHERGKPLSLPARGAEGFRLVVVAGYRKGRLTSQAEKDLVRYVEHGGGAILFLGNDERSMEDLLASELASVTPVEGRKGPPEPSVSLPFVPGAETPLFRVLPHGTANRHAWRSLPPIRMATARLGLRPGARTLATFPRFPEDVPAMAVRFAGTGVSVLFNTDQLHLWKMLMAPSGDRDHVYDRFQGNLISWLTDASGGAGVELSISGLRHRLGDEVFLRVDDHVGRLGAEGLQRLRLKVVDEEGGVTELHPRAVERGAVVSHRPERAGTYRYEADLPGAGPGGKDLHLVKESMVLEENREFDDPRADGETLADLARLSGGVHFGPGTMDVKRVVLDPTPLERKTVVGLDWLDQGTALALLLALLAVEWLLRKRRNLV